MHVTQTKWNKKKLKSVELFPDMYDSYVLAFKASKNLFKSPFDTCLNHIWSIPRNHSLNAPFIIHSKCRIYYYIWIHLLKRLNQTNCKVVLCHKTPLKLFMTTNVREKLNTQIWYSSSRTWLFFWTVIIDIFMMQLQLECTNGNSTKTMLQRNFKRNFPSN